MDPTHRHLQIACRPQADSMADLVMSDILAVADVHQRVITKLSESRKVHKYFEMSPEAQHAFLHSSAAQSVTCIVSNGHKGASSQIISALPNLKLIACYGVGVDAVDLDSGQFF
jgi:lactate dehydrogenase-like 2-hydroxyacid dehydrogenase